MAEQLERLGIGQCVGVLHRPAVDDVAYGELGDLPADRARNVGYLNYLFWNVVRAGVRANARANSLTELVAHRRPAGEAHEQHDPFVLRAVALHRLGDDDALGDFGKLLDLPIDLRRSDPHAPRIVPKAHGHARERRRAHELTRRADEWEPRLIEHLDAHAKAARLQLAAVHRPDRVAEGEARDDVRAAADAAQPDVALDLCVDVIEAVLGERAAGGEDRREGAQIMRVGRANARLLGKGQP